MFTPIGILWILAFSLVISFFTGTALLPSAVGFFPTSAIKAFWVTCLTVNLFSSLIPGTPPRIQTEVEMTLTTTFLVVLTRNRDNKKRIFNYIVELMFILRPSLNHVKLQLLAEVFDFIMKAACEDAKALAAGVGAGVLLVLILPMLREVVFFRTPAGRQAPPDMGKLLVDMLRVAIIASFTSLMAAIGDGTLDDKGHGEFVRGVHALSLLVSFAVAVAIRSTRGRWEVVLIQGMVVLLPAIKIGMWAAIVQLAITAFHVLFRRCKGPITTS